MNYRFQVTVHARPSGVAHGPVASVAGRPCPTLAVSAAQMNAPFSVTFEAVLAAFEKFPRMFCEPDGSLVWVGPLAGGQWQIDGNLFDHDGRLVFVDLRGLCPADDFDRLLTVLGWPQTPLMFQLVHEAVFLEESEFRRLAAAAALAT